MSEAPEKQSVILKGIVGSPGACMARAYVFRKRIEVKRVEISDDQIDAELERYDAAVKMTAADIQAFRRKAEERHGEKYAAIFDSHLLMLEDPQFGPKLVAKLKKEKVNVESIVRDTVDQLHKAFSAIEDPYLRERAIDIKDVGGRLLRHLMGLQGPAAEIGDEPYVLVAQEVTPSEMLDFAKGQLRGICLDTGGATSHVAILAGALAIPSVFGLSNFSLVARTGDLIMLDTRRDCRLVLNPDVAEIARFNDSLEKTGQDKVLSDRTADGWRLNIAANIVRSEELPALEQLGVQRIGLFRSEFIFMESVDLPSEKFQTEVYTRVVTAAPKMAVLRTIDIGSDKPLRYVPLAHEENPAMGFRSVRFSLSRPDIIEPQLRAMIRAAQAGNCRIIFPMVSVLSELAEIDALYRRIVAEVKPEKVPEWGIMLEVPSAVFMLADIARYTRYISLGTNDLLQFFFAVDRTNEKLAGIADMMSLPFLRLMSLCVNEAQRHSIKVGICGEMASDPYGFVALLGLGVDEFSMRPAALKNIMALIPQISREQARAVVQSMLLNPPDDGDCRAFLRANFPL
ncbi:MAG: phosphoenolpyruvate--protein phosphotransferase [Candidatus Riflebacteria bacterium HGW-Riflebacteria-1]|jgi:phosphotransferase system enzyme I (PtsI)|nr:MAG: phosphoenolpyruvate--protein phosphotransferase [Candidatus Riflebacteria bacterium HGW-Riflebacteria-1]